MIKKGSAGEAVKRLQAVLGAPQTGTLDARTDALLKAFQRRHRLKPDGIVGPKTWPKLAEEAARAKKIEALWPRVEIVKVDLPASAQLGALVEKEVSYAHMRLRASTAEKLRAALAELKGSGVTLTTSGAMRSLRKEVGRAMSATSFHYSGRALDLGVYTGGQRPTKDPIVVALDPALASERRFRVYARATNINHPLVQVIRPRALSMSKGAFVRMPSTPLVDITALFERHGLRGIGARSWAWGDAWNWSSEDYKGLEWWHFQDEEGLEEGLSTFGDDLLAVHGYERAAASAPWAHAGAFFGEGYQ